MFKFSVIIPTFNRAKALSRCLDSLVEQTFKNFEVIVCDDGSTDDTNDKIGLYRDKLNLIYNYAENWGGAAMPRNRGIELASGEWVCFLDSDDWWDANKLEVILKYTDSDFNVLYHSLQHITSGNKQRKIHCRVINNKDPRQDLLINLNTLLTSSVCVKAGLLKKTSGFSLRKDIIGLEDYDFWIRLGGEGGRFKLIDLSLGYYFDQGDDNITYEDERQIARFEKLYLPYYSDPSLAAVKSKIWGSYCFHHGRILQDAVPAIEGSYKKYLLKAFLNGSYRVKLMALKRLMRF